MTPGQRLAQLIKRYPSQKAAAEALGISPPYLGDVCLDRRGISAEMAVRLSAEFGPGTGEKLLRLQAQADFVAAKTKMSP